METKQHNESFDKYLDFLKLIQSPEWALWQEFLDDHKIWMQGRANQSLREGNMLQASIYLALMDECDMQIEAFKMRGSLLKKEVEKMEHKK